LSHLAKNANLPCISIHLHGDVEEEAKAGFNDFQGSAEVPIDPETIVSTFTATSFTSSTGKVEVPDAVDLSNVYKGRFWVEGMGQSLTILDPISNIVGEKFFHIAKMATVDLTNTTIVSCINKRLFECKFIPSAENVMIGIHSENALLTRYIYYIVRHILWTKKDKFRELDLQLSKYDGSDFQLQQDLLSESSVYSRWVTAKFISYNTYKDKEVTPIDAIQPSMGGAGAFENIIPTIAPTTYVSSTGIITIPDGIDLSIITIGRDYFFDTIGSKFKIKEFVNTLGSKTLKIKLGKTVDTSGNTSIRRAYRTRVLAESEREDEIDFGWETDIDDSE